jgi:hypothetical protein
VGGECGHVAPMLKAAMGVEDLVDQPAHDCDATSTVVRTRGSPWTLPWNIASSMPNTPASLLERAGDVIS